MRHLGLTAAFALITSVSTAAPAAADGLRVPRVEFGANFTCAPAFFYESPVFLMGGGPRVNINITRRLGVEALLDVLGPDRGPGALGLYVTQMRYASRSPDTALAVTFGVGGIAQYQRFRELRVTRLDGSTVVFPPHTRLRVDAPRAVALGLAGDPRCQPSRDRVMGCAGTRRRRRHHRTRVGRAVVRCWW